MLILFILSCFGQYVVILLTFGFRSAVTADYNHEKSWNVLKDTKWKNEKPLPEVLVPKWTLHLHVVISLTE